MSPTLLFLSLLFVTSEPGGIQAQRQFQRPHIIYILADDMGWNDVSYHGSDQIPTPNIDSLAYNGVILNRHYVQPLCTPSRASLMTGKYPIHTGIHTALAPSHKTGLPLTEKILPEYLKELGYATHLVGKWHLGFYKKEFTPLRRGFDSHFGYWTGAISFYDHISEDIWPVPPNKYLFSGHDMRRNYSSAWDVVGQYATDLFTEEAVKVIDNHPLDKPLYLFLSHLAVHAGNQGKWLEAPQEEINRFSYISNPNRRTYAAMVSKLDQSIGAVVEALDKKDMLKNSIIVFLSDNGAPNIGLFNNWGSNYPFRGQKASLWEGAVRTPAVVWSPLIAKPSRVSQGLMHVTDWLPTLLHVAGYDNNFLKHFDIDGLNLWPSISRGLQSPRAGLVLDIDEKYKMSGVIINHFKFLNGVLPPNSKPEISGFLNFDSITSQRAPRYDVEEISASPAWRALQKFSKFSRDPQLGNKIKDLRYEATVFCDHNLSKFVNCTAKPCLFDLQKDPCEQDNIAKSFPGFVSQIQELMRLYKLGSVPDVWLYQDLVSNPEFFNGTWSIWES